MNNNGCEVAIVATVGPMGQRDIAAAVAFLRQSLKNPSAVPPDSQNPTVSFY